ncbi:MAG: PIN domain-containing protein [bacterium]
MKPANWLDSSAVLTLLMAESGYDVVRDLLIEAEEGRAGVYLAQISLVEVAHAIAHSHGAEAAMDDIRLVQEMPMEIQGATHDQCLRAGLLRGRYRLSTADAVIATQAQDAGAVLVHKDPEFEGVEGLKQLCLPYKPTKRGKPQGQTLDHRRLNERGGAV